MKKKASNYNCSLIYLLYCLIRDVELIGVLWIASNIVRDTSTRQTNDQNWLGYAFFCTYAHFTVFDKVYRHLVCVCVWYPKQSATYMFPRKWFSNIHNIHIKRRIRLFRLIFFSQLFTIRFSFLLCELNIFVCYYIDSIIYYCVCMWVCERERKRMIVR